MLLAIDVGNTNITIGIFEGKTLTQSWRLATIRERTADELGILLKDLLADRGLGTARVDGVIMASVVPPLTGVMADMVRRYVGRESLLVEPQSNAGIKVLYENPADVGADRVVNGVAAYELYGRARGVPVIVVDFGTATTFDAISAAGEYLGGAICPGIQISADALFQRAARLPKVEVRKPAGLIGRTTVASMQAGLFFGYVGLVEGIVHRMRNELAAASGHATPAGRGDVACVATGGMAHVISPETDCIDDVNPELTLHGLRMVWEKWG
jgi:type III pantothenate kinase